MAAGPLLSVTCTLPSYAMPVWRGATGSMTCTRRSGLRRRSGGGRRPTRVAGAAPGRHSPHSARGGPAARHRRQRRSPDRRRAAGARLFVMNHNTATRWGGARLFIERPDLVPLLQRRVLARALRNDELAQPLQCEAAPQDALHGGEARVRPAVHHARVHELLQLALGEHCMLTPRGVVGAEDEASHPPAGCQGSSRDGHSASAMQPGRTAPLVGMVLQSIAAQRARRGTHPCAQS